MPINRRRFLYSASTLTSLSCAASAIKPNPSFENLDGAADMQVLHLDHLTDPILIRHFELYRLNDDHILKVISQDGGVGYTITNNRAFQLYPLLRNNVLPFFIKQDARHLEMLLDKLYVYKSNYKLQGLALWCCVAWTEMAILDLLGRISNKRLGDLMGGVLRENIPVYYASGNRQTSPQEECDILKRKVEEHGVKAVKFKVGGRMSHNEDSIPGRSEALIPLARKTLGDSIDIHSDSNGSYDPPKAIDIGKRLQDIQAIFFEEPCPFDHLDDTKRVADSLDIDVAGGECESSHRRFRWMIRHNAVQVVQPDLHYYGGFIRSRRVANMAAVAGMPITLHMGGSGVGFVEVVQFASCTPNIGPYQEFKEGFEKSIYYDPPLSMNDGAVSVPKGAGLGLAPLEDRLKKAEKIFSV
ncbi:mandelate racemase/muconate lactonizing enzyme family protein [bacterium]|nr:mandelate racemase/muconate lactonizing enzyme family protein [bacterium]